MRSISPTSSIVDLRTQILENYRIIDPDNADAVLVIASHKKNQKEILDYPVVTYTSEDISEALLVTHPDKGKEVLMRGSSPWGDSKTPLRRLFAHTCELLGHKIASDYK